MSFMKSPYQFVLTSFNLGNSYLRLGKTKEAIEILERSRSTAYENSITKILPSILKKLSITYHLQERDEKAFALLYECDSLKSVEKKK